MSNLGGYQTLTTVAKAVKGPRNLVLIAGAAFIGIGILGDETARKIKRTIDKNKKAEREAYVYRVSKEGTSNVGLVLHVGDRFKVLDYDEDAVMIKIFGRNDNPHWVSGKLLKSISDYK